MSASASHAESGTAKTDGSAPAVVVTAAAIDDARWEAVRRRDATQDGQFVYAVRTTGVYCRPGCPSRLARRENVRFHATCELAERAGFRACKRCRPQEVSLAERQQDAVAEACRMIEAAGARHEPEPDLEALAVAAGMSRYHFHRVFKHHTGVTPKAYARAQRSQRVRATLASGGSVTGAIYDAGYQSSGPFYATANAALGMTPTAFRDGGSGTTIRFAVGATSLGAVLVAASRRGVCAILLGDDADELARDLQDRFPAAQLEPGDAAFAGWVAAVVGVVEQPTRGLDLPLDIQGTAFQVRVWEALRQIPPGTTTTYSELAARLGQPAAARAVAGACAANRLAVAVPCHRVVRTDASLSGYRWGVERKAELLRRERANDTTANDSPEKFDVMEAREHG